MSSNEDEKFYSNYEEKHYTLIFCRRKQNNINQILLGMKKRGFGVGKWNGFGGKVENGESFEEGAKRELEEESTLRSQDLKSIGYLVFRMLDSRKYMKVHVFESWEFDGVETETEEMRPHWYNENEIPFDKMWLDDKYWFPYLLQGKKFVGSFEYEDEETITDYSVKEQ